MRETNSALSNLTHIHKLRTSACNKHHSTHEMFLAKSLSNWYVNLSLNKKPFQASKVYIGLPTFARLKTIHIAHNIIRYLGTLRETTGLTSPRAQKQTTSHTLQSKYLRLSAWNKQWMFLAKTQRKIICDVFGLNKKPIQAPKVGIGVCSSFNPNQTAIFYCMDGCNSSLQ